MNEPRLIEKVKRDFTPPELLAFKDELARKFREHIELSDAKAQVTGRMNEQLKTLYAEIEQLSDQIATGFEWIDGELIVLLDQPGPGQKTLVRVDTGEEHRIEAMTPEDRQRSFFEPHPAKEE